MNPLTVLELAERMADIADDVAGIRAAFERMASALERIARTYEHESWPQHDDTPVK